MGEGGKLQQTPSAPSRPPAPRTALPGDTKGRRGAAERSGPAAALGPGAPLAPLAAAEAFPPASAGAAWLLGAGS